MARCGYEMRRWAVWPNCGAAVNLLRGDFVLSWPRFLARAKKTQAIQRVHEFRQSFAGWVPGIIQNAGQDRAAQAGLAGEIGTLDLGRADRRLDAALLGRDHIHATYVARRPVHDNGGIVSCSHQLTSRQEICEIGLDVYDKTYKIGGNGDTHMAFNAKTYRINKWARDAYKTLDRARSEKSSPFCDPKRVQFLARMARFEMRCHLSARGLDVQSYSVSGR